MGGQEIDNFNGGESGITHTSKDGVGRVGGLWNGQIGSGPGDVGAACEERNTRAASAVGNTNSTGELNEVAERDLVLDGEGALGLDDLVNSNVGICEES